MSGYIHIYLSVYICAYYLKKISVKINMATDDGNSRNET